MTAAIFGAAAGVGVGAFFATNINAPKAYAISSDGISWQSVTPSSTIEASGNNGRCLLANGSFIGFTNGWTVSQSGLIAQQASITATAQGMAFGAGVYVAPRAANPSGFGIAYSSSIGGTWTNVNLNSEISGGGSAIAFLEGLFIVVSPKGEVFTSTDGINWTSRYTGSWANNPTNNSISYGNGHYVMQGRSGLSEYLYSSNGTSWSSKTISGFSGADILETIYWNGTWYAFNNSKVATTTTPDNAASWSVTSISYAGGLTSINGVAASENHLIAYGSGASGSSRAAYSTDGINWTATNLNSIIGAGGGAVIAWKGV